MKNGTVGTCRRVLGGVSLMAVAATALYGCGGAVSAAPQASKSPLVINIAGPGAEPGSLDPAVDYDNGGYSVIPAMYDNLVRSVGTTNARVAPDLATSWSSSANQLTWTFHLRPNVKFHDGTAADAAAVKFAFDRFLQMKQGGWADFADIGSITTPDPLTVVFHLKYHFRPFLASLTSFYGPAIVSPTAIRKHEVHGDLGAHWLTDHDAGSGPYELVNWTHGQSITLNHFPGYWGGWSGHHASGVVFQYSQSSATVRLGLQNGSVDAAVGLSPQDLSALAAASGISVQDHTGSVIRYVAFNTTQGPLRSPLVRRALATALDVPSIAKYVWNGFATPMSGYAPTGIPGYTPSPAPYTYNLARARALLTQAGLTHGFATHAYYFTGDTPGSQLLQVWQAALAKIGVNLTVSALPYSEFASLQTKPSTSPPIVENTWSLDYADASNNIYFLWLYSQNSSTSGNFAFYKNPAVDALLLKARAALSEQLPLFRRIMAITYPQAPYIPLVQERDRIALANNVHGYAFNLGATEYYFPVYDMWKS